MKLWMRLLVGSVIGILLGAYLPEQGGDTAAGFAYWAQVGLHLGRYVILPLVLFQVGVSIYELRSERKLIRVYLKSFVVLIAGTVVMVLIGTLAVLVFSPARIPPILQETQLLDLPSARELPFMLFPKNLFTIFVAGSANLLPIYFLSFLLGCLFGGDGYGGDGLAGLFESAAHLFMRLNALVCEVIGLAFIAFGALFLLRFRAINDIDIFAPYLLVVVVSAFFIVLGVLPLAVYLLGGRENPYRWLYGMLAPMLAGLFSADSFFSLGMLERVGGPNLGAPRMVRGAVFPLYAMFGRAGTAMVSASAFMVILQSYTALEIGFGRIVWVMASAMFAGLLLAAYPASGVSISLAMLSASYQSGNEEIYLIMQPILPILLALAVLLDVAFAGFAAHVVSRHEEVGSQLDMMEMQ